MHDVFVGDVTVGKDRLVHLMFLDEFCQPFFGVYGDSFGLIGTSQFWGILSFVNARNLCGGEGYYVILFVVSEVDVEIVEISAGSSHYDNPDFSVLRR